MSQYLDKDGASRIAENFLSKQAEQDAILRNLQFDLKEAEHALVKTIQGPAPLNIRALTRPFDDYLISGKTVQDGTPTPEDPVDVVGCGVRTGNLFDYVSYFSSTFIQYSEYFDYAEVQLIPNTTYTFSTDFIDGETVGGIKEVPFIVMNSTETPLTVVGGLGNNTTRTLTTDSSGVVRVYKRIVSNSQAEIPTLQDFQNGKWVMCNRGSTALPYEPYGYKLPITVNSTEYPIYLGNVQTTRRVKKLVLMGDENWNLGQNYTYYNTDITDYLRSSDIPISICSHYKSQAPVLGTSFVSDMSLSFYKTAEYSRIYIRDTSLTTVAAFKSYLAAQYANGTPVTVWYVLVEPETGIVNEPLHKIGDYADTVSMAQAGIEISTTKGFNTITTDTTVLPSNIEVKGVINNA